MTATARTTPRANASEAELFTCAKCAKVFAAIGDPAERCPCGGELRAGAKRAGLFELAAADRAADVSTLEESVPASVLKPHGGKRAEKRAPDDASTESSRDDEVVDHGYGESHGYGPAHGGPTGPGDAPAREPATVVPIDDA